MNPKTFVIVGLGLLGGSLGGALRRNYPNARIIGVSRSRAKINLARRKKLITRGTTNLQDAVQAADLVFICTPVDTIQKLIFEIDRLAKKGTVVTDVGSTKGELIQWVLRKQFKNISFVGSHPMAGSHVTGVRYANAELFHDSLAFVTTHQKVSQNALRLVCSVWQKIGSRTVLINSELHDAITAEISHFPHLVAALLVDIATPHSLSFASTGFFDTTRVAQGDPRLWVPIVMTNRKNLIRLLVKLQKLVKQLETWLRKGKQNELHRFLEKAARRRLKIRRK